MLILYIYAINAKFPKEIPLNLYPILNYSLSPDNETSTRTTSSRNIIHDLILSHLGSVYCGITSKFNLSTSTRGRKYRRWYGCPVVDPNPESKRSIILAKPSACYRQFLRNLAKLLNERELEGTLPDGERPRPRSFPLGRAYLLVA